MNQVSNSAKPALTSASGLLVAQWVMAIVSIPSARDYTEQIAAGTSPDKIVTLYDNLALLITITLAWSWISTNRFLTGIYDQVTSVNAEAVRLKRGWVTWGWIVPVVSFWFPKRIVDDLLKARVGAVTKPNGAAVVTSTWWTTWISFILLNNLSAFNTLTGQADPIQPTYEIAGACMLTASYLVWIKILKALDSSSLPLPAQVD